MRQVPSAQVLAGRQSGATEGEAAPQVAETLFWNTVLLLSLYPSLGA